MAESHLPTRGSSQGGLKQYNERAVLQAVRLMGALPAADIARHTGLTAQTVSLISKRLLDEGYLLKGEPTRGRVGQPSVPLSLNPEGAYAVGIKVGRRHMETLLVDFTGAVRARWTLDYRFPEPDVLLEEVSRRLTGIKRKLGPDARDRVQGVGVAAPLALGGWQSLLGLTPELSEQWSRLDLRAEVQRLSDWPVDTMKDTAAACVAELVAGRGRSVRSFVYMFVDTFIGGGLVIESHLRAGASGNAGAVGSMPLGLANGGAPPQLLSVASLNTLEQAWAAQRLPEAAPHQVLDTPWRDITLAWVREAGVAIAHAVNSAACLLDLEAVILDGVCDRALLEQLLQATEAAMRRYSWEGVAPPRLLPGTIGADAGALGGALLPLYANFAPDRDLFLKDATA